MANNTPKKLNVILKKNGYHFYVSIHYPILEAEGILTKKLLMPQLARQWKALSQQDHDIYYEYAKK